MQKTKFSARLVSFVLTLAILLSMFSVFAFAEESQDTGVSPDELSVAFNRTFSEGWDYDNGIVDGLAKGNTAELAHEYRNSGYNHYLKLTKQNTKVSYLYIDTENRLATSGKTFIELDITAGARCAMGQAVRVSVQNDIKTLVEFRDDGMYVLGENVGSAVYSMKWESLGFEFDFDYVSEETLDTAFKVSAYHNGTLISTKIWEYGRYGAGITQVRFAFGDVREDSVGSWYGVDNVRVYSGVDTFTELESEEYGLAVDTTLPKDYELAGNAADPDGYLRGTPKVERLDNVGTASVHYNRHFGEGWDLTNGAEIVAGGNNVDIKSEKDLEGNYNYFYRFRALGTTAGYLKVPVVSYPTNSALYLELDMKAGVNTNLGKVLEVRSDSGSMYAASIVNGELQLFGDSVGYIGSDWVHLIFVFSNTLNGDGNYTCTVYYGASGQKTCDYNIGVVTEFRIGTEAGGGDDKFGDWFGVDNLQIYSGTKQFVTIPADDYGFGVNATLPKDFELKEAEKAEEPVVPDTDEEVGVGDFKVQYGENYVLRGEPDLPRVEVDEDTWIRYNRHFGEGWDFGHGFSSSSGAGNQLFDLQAEQTLDLTYNYYQYYEKLSGTDGWWSFSAGNNAPTTGSVYLEMDLRAVEGCDVGRLFQIDLYSTENTRPTFLGFEDGYLVTYIGSTSGVKLGKIGEDEWVHVAVQFDFDYDLKHPESVKSGKSQYQIRIWAGEEVYYECVRETSACVAPSFRVGLTGADVTTYGHFANVDNLQYYGGTSSFANLPEDNYGTAVNANAEKDFPIQTTTVSIDDMILDSLFMKIGSEHSLVNGERADNLYDEATAKAYGCPTLVDDVLWIPLDTVLNFLSYPIYIHEDGLSFDISTGTKITYITLGRNTAVVGSEKINLTAAPAMVTDKLGYEFLGVTIDDLILLFPEFHINRDDMNMIVFSKHETIASGNISETIRMDIMKDFLFEYLTADELYERAADYTNNFDHPYLITNQERFDELHEVWVAGQTSEDDDPTNDVEFDATLYSYIRSIVASANTYYNKYSASNVNITITGGGSPYDGLNPLCYLYDNESSGYGLQHSYKSTAGYDPVGGRLYPPYDPLEPFAYAYQVTRDIRYAQIAYDYANELVDWDHWGPGHFLNAADTAAAVSLCYDWLYDAWVELGADVDKIADGIFYHGALQGYLVSTGNPDPHGRLAGNGSVYTKMVNNWNAVCTAGMASAAFAVMDYKNYSVDTKLAQSKASLRAEIYGGEQVRYVCSTLITMNYKTLIANGLAIYAPDGSYEESVSYWAYGAGNLFRYSQILESCLGDDLGIMDCWGLDRTCYSILHMVSSDFRKFSYNDTTTGGACSSGYFNYVAQAVGDDFLRLVRQMHINDGGLAVSMTDSLFYKVVDPNADIEMPLQYYHIGIDGYTTRSSWERGAVFAGLLGGDNDDGHGHIDAGQWIYYSHGIAFIEDMGADGYNTYNYFSNNHMYRTTVEGHNCILVSSDQTSLPAGQLRDSVSPMIEYYDNEYGSYAIMDTLPAFGNTLISSYRGMMHTNDRNTVIVQDEIVPNGNQTVNWIAHYTTDMITDVELTNNGRTAIFTSKRSSVTGQPVTMRMNIISNIRGISFKKLTAYDYLLDATMRPGDSEAMGKQPESDRSNWLKLVVTFENMMSIDFAVELEVIDPSNPISSGYSKIMKMNNWMPGPDTRVVDDTEEEEFTETSTIRGTAQASDLIGYAARLDSMFDAGTHYDKIADFYAAITQMNYTVIQRGREYFESNSMFADSLYKFDSYYSLYDAYLQDVGQTTTAVFAITDMLTASKTKAADEATE